MPIPGKAIICQPSPKGINCPQVKFSKRICEHCWYFTARMLSAEVAEHIHLTAAKTNSFFFKVITQKVVAIDHNKSWTFSGRKESLAGPDGHPNIDC